MNVVEPYSKELALLAQRYGVARLELFGSAATQQFDPKTSDMDFLVEFKSDAPSGKFDAFFGLQQELSELFNRRVDLVSKNAIKNPYFLKSIEKTRRAVYVA